MNIGVPKGTRIELILWAGLLKNLSKNRPMMESKVP